MMAASASRRQTLHRAIRFASLAGSLWLLVPSSHAAASVSNGNFSMGLDGWGVEDGLAVDLVSDASGCEDESCLRIDAPPGRWHAISREVASLAVGTPIDFSVRVHASTRQHVRVGIRGLDWRNRFCAARPLRVYVEARGSDEWRTLRGQFAIPEADDCAAIDDQRWRIFVEVLNEDARRSAVLIDRVMLSKANVAPKVEPASVPRCGWFDDRVTVEVCPGAPAASETELSTRAKWSLGEREGRLAHDTVLSQDGVFEGKQPRWTNGALSFDGTSERVRVDAGQVVSGSRFEIALDVKPRLDFTAGCLLATRPASGTVGGFRLCLDQREQWISFEVGDRGETRRYTATLSQPLPSDVFSRIAVTRTNGELEMRVDAQTLRAFSAPRLRLTKGPHPLVMGGALETDREGFAGELRNVTLRAPGSKGSGVRLGYVTRGQWPLDGVDGGLVRDIAGGHHGVLQDQTKREPPRFEGGRFRFTGKADAAPITMPKAGPLYGDNLRIAFDAWIDDPGTDWGTLVASKTGGSVQGGFLVDYLGAHDQLVAKLAGDGKQIVSTIALPFDWPAKRWVPVELILRHGELVVRISRIEVGRFPHADFSLSPAHHSLIVGSYYYPPSKGVRGSVRDLVLQMHTDSIAEDEDRMLRPPAPRRDETVFPCLPESLGERWLVARNLIVPNWVPTSCLEKRFREKPFRFEVDVPEGFELEGSGASEMRDGRVIEYDVGRGNKIEHAGRKYRRHTLDLGYRVTPGYTAGYGPLYLRAKKDAPGRATLRVRRLPVDGEESAPEQFTELEIEVRDFPTPGMPKRLHHSLTWMKLAASSTWPDFFENYAALGFNVVPMMTLYDAAISKRTRLRFVKRARKEGFEILALDSPYHRLIFHEQARVLNHEGVRQPFIDPSYRGQHYDAEVDRMASGVGEIEPEWVMMDIECFSEGAHACLVGAAPECTRYMSREMAEHSSDPASAVTDLGTELVVNIRRALAKAMPDRAVPRMGINTSEPDYVYHHLFDFDKLYGVAVDYAQPILYRQPASQMGKRIRSIRAALPRGDIIPWIDPGTVVEFPSPVLYDRMLEVFGSGGGGLAWFAFENFEGEDFFHVAAAMDAVIPVEDLIVDGMPADGIEVLRGGVEASGLASPDGSALLLVRDYTKASPREVELVLPTGVQGAMWDLASKQRIATVQAGRVRFEWRPGVEGAHTALYYVGRAPFENGRFATAPPSAPAPQP